MTEHNLPDKDDAPWLNLSQEEINELRNKKFELTQYGKQKLKEKMNESITARISDEDYQKVLNLMKNQEPYPDEMLEKVENHLTLKYEEMLEIAEKRERSNTVLARYNKFYNDECSGLPQGMPISMEQMQMITLQSMIDALRCEHLNQEYTHIAITDIEDLIEALYQQSTAFLERVKKFKEEKND